MKPSAPNAVSDIGIVGLATMGRNLALNFLDHGQCVSAWNLEPELTTGLENAYQGQGLYCAPTIEELIATLKRPRRVLLMIRAGAAVDQMLDQLAELLSPGDIVIDGGNSQFEATRERSQRLGKVGLEFVGLGVSGGASGARHGPSLMAGSSEAAWQALQPALTSIAARSPWGPCADRMGPDGAGHFVKMIHNGIEYGDMQLIAEVYDICRRSGWSAPEIGELFERWQSGPLQSFLIDITIAVLRHPDADGRPLVDQVLDVAEQKGTGRWTVQQALNLGVPIPTITAAVEARSVSALQSLRAEASGISGPLQSTSAIDETNLLSALLVARLCAYAQGMSLLAAGSEHYQWDIDPASVLRVWTGGCIIRAALLDQLIEACATSPPPASLILFSGFRETLQQGIPALRRVIAAAVTCGAPVPALAASLCWLDGISSQRLPQNLTQAQRDAFGAHTFRHIQDPDGPPRHAEWLPQ
ncbi:MAG: NADP-dependent phosphogluconate dehydrogenase [Proteobacteria bacterium]|nr:NADP-dependent phosphogluconate dehydrogenase [Pseudomonadota bacterium]